MRRNRENNQIKHSHVKYEMSKILALLEAGAYCTTDCFPLITPFATDHYVCYLSHNSLLLTSFSIITTRFTALSKKLPYQNIVNSLRSLMMTQLRNSKKRACTKKLKYLSK